MLASLMLLYFIFDFRLRFFRFRRMKKAVENSSSSSSSSTKTRRLLDGIESFCYFRQRSDHLVHVSVGFIRSLYQPLEMQLLKSTAQRLAHRHPTLRQRIKETQRGADDSVPYMEMDEGEVEVSVKTRSTTDWKHVVEQEMLKGFPVKGPQWRIRLLQAVKMDKTDSSSSSSRQQVDETDSGSSSNSSNSSSSSQQADKAGRAIYFENPVVISVNQTLCHGTSFIQHYDQLVKELALCSSSSSSSLPPPVVSQPPLPTEEGVWPDELFQVRPAHLFVEYLGIQWGRFWRHLWRPWSRMIRRTHAGSPRIET